jgi:isopentenyl-diphosphate delta-isomerase
VPLIQVAELSYRAEDAVSGLVEREYLHVFHGTYSGDPKPDPDEISAWQWTGKERIRANLASNPEQFTPWFAILVDGHVVD